MSKTQETVNAQTSKRFPRRPRSRSAERSRLYGKQIWPGTFPTVYQSVPVLFRELLPYFSDRGNRLVVFMALLLTAAHDKSECCWSQEALAKHLGISARSISRMLSDLGELGFVSYPIANKLKPLVKTPGVFVPLANSHVVFGMGHTCDHLLDIRDEDGRFRTVQDGRHADLDLPPDRLKSLKDFLVKHGYWASQVWLARTKDQWLNRLEEKVSPRLLEELRTKLCIRKHIPNLVAAPQYYIHTRSGERPSREIQRVFASEKSIIEKSLSNHLDVKLALANKITSLPFDTSPELNAVILLDEKQEMPKWWQWEPDLRDLRSTPRRGRETG